MSKYDTTRPVMITGATGYVAGRIIERLLGEGFTVHATVRDPSKAEKLTTLDALAERLPGTIQYFKADLLDPDSYAEAMKNCQVVFHTASPFTLNVQNPQKDLVEPAQLGTRYVLEEADRQESVERVVVTSSCAAIYGDNADLADAKEPKFTEEDWNTTSSLDHQAYSYSKTLSEREAWKIAGAQDRWELVVVNPSFVLGPGIGPHASSASYAIMKQFGDGTMKAGVPDYRVGIIDVRDLAQAHFGAGFEPGANGRNIASAHDSSFVEIGTILREEIGGDFPFPKRKMPKWLVWLVAPMIDKSMTRKIISKNVGFPFCADASKAQRELGLKFRPLEETVVDMFQQMIDAGMFEKKGG